VSIAKFLDTGLILFFKLLSFFSPLYPLNLDEANAVRIAGVLKLAKGKVDGPGGAAEMLGSIQARYVRVLTS
jgi:hypothetical protein